MKKVKKIPYGTVDYATLQKNNKYYFVDKTRYIKELEELGSRFLFFLRPRRFGKSLWLSILEHYYDVNKADQFEELFGDTYIGKNPTPLRNTYPILKLNFSGIPTDGSAEDIKKSFDLEIFLSISDFYVSYSHLYDKVNIDLDFVNISNATDMLKKFISIMKAHRAKFYLLIDEYDNFANNVLIHHGKERYQRVTHQAGFLRSFFAAIKNATETSTIDRMFVTGVSPLVLSDVTSGMNIGDNISNMIPFNSMVGFTQGEVEVMLDYYINAEVVKKEERAEISEILRVNYNNYCFSENTDEKVYNSDMILYFFNKYSQNKKIPSNLIDENVRIDYGKLRFLILEEQKLNGNFSILSDIIENGSIDTQLIHSFALKDILEKSKFKSFLYYLGLLTIKKHYIASRYQLTIPNEVIRTMHFDYIRQALTESFKLNIDIEFLEQEFANVAIKGEWQALFEYILDKFYENTSLRDFVLLEHSIKMFLLPYLGFSPYFYVDSEPEMNRGYADLFFQSKTDITNYEYLIELKYLKSKDLPKDKEKLNALVQKTKQAATEQLLRYKQSREITCELIQIVIICSSKEVLLLEEVK